MVEQPDLIVMLDAPRKSYGPTPADDPVQRIFKSIIRQNGTEFRDKAERFAINYLQDGPASGEKITDACKAAGIRPHDDRAFGSVYHSLARRGLIIKIGTCRRQRGHGTTGGNIWRKA